MQWETWWGTLECRSVGLHRGGWFSVSFARLLQRRRARPENHPDQNSISKQFATTNWRRPTLERLNHFEKNRWLWRCELTDDGYVDVDGSIDYLTDHPFECRWGSFRVENCSNWKCRSRSDLERWFRFPMQTFMQTTWASDRAWNEFYLFKINSSVSSARFHSYNTACTLLTHIHRDTDKVR